MNNNEPRMGRPPIMDRPVRLPSVQIEAAALESLRHRARRAGVTLSEMVRRLLDTEPGGARQCATGHDWQVNDETGRTYCARCGADGDA